MTYTASARTVATAVMEKMQTSRRGEGQSILVAHDKASTVDGDDASSNPNTPEVSV